VIEAACSLVQDLPVLCAAPSLCARPRARTRSFATTSAFTSARCIAKANGRFDVQVDGKQVKQQSGVEFRARDGKDTLISRMLFSTFHGGNSPANAPKDNKGNFITVHADFDNLLVTEGW
jgi:hypothetical protein